MWCSRMAEQKLVICWRCHLSDVVFDFSIPLFEIEDLPCSYSLICT